MRQALQRKLRSQRGASMLLALLFLALCTMVAASILMAAVANAGKHRSNLEEHQQYLALSSAVSMLCDELNRAEYRGQYSYWSVTPTETEGEGEDKTETRVTTYYFEQKQGLYHQKNHPEKNGALQEILQDDFDAIFAQHIKDNASKIAAPLSSSNLLSKPGNSWSHTLTVTPDTGITAIDGTDENPQTISVKLTVNNKYAIFLTATLGDYTIYADLTPAVSAPALPAELTADENPPTVPVQKTNAMQWKIGWITTGQEREEEETP